MKTNNKGFSLVELIVVIAIMAIIISVFVPQYIRYIEKSRQGKDADAIGVIQRAISVAMSDTSIDDRPNYYSGNLVYFDNGIMPNFASAIKEYIGDYTMAEYKVQNIRSYAYRDSIIYVDIDGDRELVRVTVSSNVAGVPDLVVD